MPLYCKKGGSKIAGFYDARQISSSNAMHNTKNKCKHEIYKSSFTLIWISDIQKALFDKELANKLSIVLHGCGLDMTFCVVSPCGGAESW